MPWSKEQQAAYVRSRSKAKLAAGLCANCGTKPHLPDRTLCLDCTATRSKAQASYEERARDELYGRYGGYVCSCCGETERMFLTLDHVNSDGAEHRRKLSKTGRGVSYKLILNDLRRRGFPSVLQVLCFNCNAGRHRNGGVCPHKATS